MTTTILVTIIICLTVIATPAVYLGFKERLKKQEPTFGRPDIIDAPEKKSKSKLKEVDDSWKRIDVVFGKVTVDDIEYTTFDAGEVLLYDRKDKPVIAFKVDGYGNEQRTINYIRVSDDVKTKDGVIYYVKHSQQDYKLFMQWLDTQLYGGELAKEALAFKDCMEEIAKFNQLLASRKLRKSGGRYIAN